MTAIVSCPLMRRLRGIVVAVVTVLIMLSSCNIPTDQPFPLVSLPVPRTAFVALPSHLPSHLGFGIASLPDTIPSINDMRSSNGAAWDYRYAYLAGGVNTGQGWASWNSPPGQFAAMYVRQNVNNGYIPCFVYYMLRQSIGPVQRDEASTDLAHLADPTTMRAYYADWALLMRTLGASHATTLVIVEPDLWGYIERPAIFNGSNSAASVPASVASSGNPDVRGLPNTAQGFAWALLRLRDRFAPNVLLAIHASLWGTREDVFTADPETANALTQQQARFLLTAGLAGTPAGISTFDVISSDIADRDSGQSGTWWDRTNQRLPNFQRYLTYAYGLAYGTARRIILWQVPIGNQYFRAEDNSAGHTQDNKAEYILGHAADFAAAGVIAVLFGAGNSGTHVYDTAGDGITNPAPIVTYQCDRCNSHISQYADDDGGYLRIFVGAYYRHGAVPLTAELTSPALPTDGPADMNG